MATTGRPADDRPDLPDLRQIVRRALRVTLAASLGFYACRYAFGRPETAIYALFGAVAMGALSRIPGSGRQRATVVLAALPIALGLVAMGTALAVHTAAAVAGMVVVGFCLAFAPVAGPRPAGAAPGLQLMYILPSFPPYAPDHLPGRLAGAAIGMLLLAAAEAWVLPVPGPEKPYRRLLADAIRTAGLAAAKLAAEPRQGPTNAPANPSHTSPDTSPDTLLDHLSDAGEALRPALLPPAERPAGAGRTDRALAQAGSATRELLAQLQALDVRAPAVRDQASRSLLTRVAESCRDTERALRGGPAPPPTRMDEAIEAFQDERLAQARRPAATRPPPGVLRHQAAVLATSVSAQIVKSSVRVAVDGRRARPLHPESVFWYARRSTPSLYWRRVRGNLTPRSVYFQNAVRITVGLSLARLTAGALDLAHGFWVLLAVLTLTRTSAMGTWRNVRLALVGTFAGALAAAGLLIGFGQHTGAYAAVLAPAMLIAFSVGPMLGVAWAQGLFTLVVASAFAQLAPANRELAQARILDVATGCLVGLVCGVLAWPRGASSEVLRAMARLLRSLGHTVEATTSAMLHDVDPPGPPPVAGASPSAAHTAASAADTPHSVPATPPSVADTRHALRLAQSSFAQLQGEAPGPARPAADRLAGRPHRGAPRAAGCPGTPGRPPSVPAPQGAGRDFGVHRTRP
ncbi:FUSC family protein [Streptodolium elevatio]